MVTNGTQYNPNNNQPVAKKNIALVHNGIIVNESELWDHLQDVSREYDVDSESILETFRNYLKITGDVKEAIADTYDAIQGMASTIWLIQKNHYMIAVSNNGSLYKCSSSDDKLIVFASERLMLEKLIDSIPDLSHWLQKKKIVQISSKQSVIVSDGYTGCCDEIHVVQDLPVISSRQGLNLKNYSRFDIDFEKIKKIRRCTKCILPETMPFIRFDKDGVCNYCKGYKRAEYKGLKELDNWQKRQITENKTAMVSFSGGRDSSYGLHFFVKEMGIKPVAYCYDWGMVTDIARRNQSRMCSQLGIELILVSADIKKKRENIRKNVNAWLKKPSLGMIPLFMAGDKHYFYYANKVKKDYNLDIVLLASNPFEKTYFKSGYCGVMPDILKKQYIKMDMERLPIKDVAVMSGYYIGQFLKNKAYLNTSIVDTFSAMLSYYMIPHDYFRLFDYIPWNENIIDETLKNQYGWECAEDIKSTWRIGDGTAPFYNYIYCLVTGFTENDTLRSNQIREGMLGRKEALELIYQDNQPRFDSLKWYFETIQIDMEQALEVINRIPRFY